MEETPDQYLFEPVTRKTVEDYLTLQGLTGQVSPQEAERFAALAIRYQLNPFVRELHLVRQDRGGFAAVVGYEVYLRKAERTGKLDGWKTWVVGDGENLKAVLEIYRHDWTRPFMHEAFYREAVQIDATGKPTTFWQNKPKFQLRKVAIAQGFRLCFPDDLGGIPYEPAELSLEEPFQPKAEDKLNKALASADGRSPFDELTEYLKAHADSFTPKHLGWIKTQILQAPTPEKAKALLGYARKVVSQGGDSQQPSRSPKTVNGRRREDPIPEPTF